MSDLTEYVDLETLQQLQDSFTAVAGLPIRICRADGQPVTEKSVLPGRPEAASPPSARTDGCAPCNVEVRVEQDVVGRIVCQSGQGLAASDATRRFLALLGGVIGRLCDSRQQLRNRVEELAALYRLTAEFSGRRDLQGVLDLVAKTVVEVMKAKACSIRLLNNDHTELVITAVANLSQEYLEKGPIMLSESKIDQEVFSTGKPVHIADQRSDERVLYPAEARREGIVSALCVAMTYKDRPEGAIRVYKGQRHEFNWFEVSLLESIARAAAAAVVNARLYQAAVKAANMKRQLKLAGEVQRRMIPAQPPVVEGFDIGAAYVPCFELGGDFYDFIDLPPDNLGLAVCDVSGKGVRASLLMASIRASLRANATKVYEIASVLEEVNGDLCAAAMVSDFATLFYGVLDFKARRLTYTNAGHPAPLLLRQGRCSQLTTGGGVLGIDPTARWEFDSFDLAGGDVIVAYTDGLSEAMNFDDDPFGHERVRAAALACVEQGLNADCIVKGVLWEMRRFAGLQTRFDDLTLVAIKVL